MERNELPDLKGKALTKFLVDKKNELMDNVCQDQELIDKFVSLWDNTELHTYSLNNIILAFWQYPKLSMLAGYKKWLKLGRHVKAKERAIRIVAPRIKKIRAKDENEEEDYIITGWSYVNVFDINQTEGKNLDFGHSDKIKGETIAFDEIKKICPLPVVVEYRGTANGSVNDERMQIAPKDNESAMVATLIHEEGHRRLGHIGNEDLSREVKETEAETVSYIVCSYLGLDNEKSQFYIGNWNGGSEMLKGRGSKLVSVAESIIRDIKRLDL